MIKDNPYISSCESSTFSVLLNSFLPNSNKFRLIHSIIKYPEWQDKIDILQFVQDKESLRVNPNTYFVLDASTEGFSPFETFFFDNLYYSCKMHNINPQKIIFVSTNMLDETNIINYNKKNKITNSIKVFCFLSFKKMMSDLVEDNFGFDFTSEKALNYFRLQTEKHYKGKYGLSLSRVNRDHRTLANFLLYESTVEENFSISQDNLLPEEAEVVQRKFNLDNSSFKKWSKTLPRTIDTSDFQTNHALSLSSHLHNSTLLQIVNETHVDGCANTTLFYSEKTFRAIAHMQPFLIFGQPGCNKNLEKYGFRLFKNLFDYSFDDIDDTKQRYLALLSTIKNTINRLNNLSVQEQIDWKFSEKETLKHNFECLMNNNLEKKKFKRLIKLL